MRGEARGAVSIEFALLFPLFLAVCYAILSYGVSLAQLHALEGLASAAARATVAVVKDDGAWEGAAAQRIDGVLARHAGVQPVTPCAPASTCHACKTAAGAVKGCGEAIAPGDKLEVCVQAPLMLPTLDLFGIRVPDIPSPLRSRASVPLPPP